ncbi:MAG: polysaccharide deacetylase family protein [Bacteroidetes bacterium]|nr:polysaccharide deacetylase family protein [Bacteroidota bacterium]
MKINIIISADEKIRQKIKYGFTLLFQPLRVEIDFSRTIAPDCPNIFYGRQLPNDSKKVLWIHSSDGFMKCISDSVLPDISNVTWFDYAGKKLPKLFVCANPLNSSLDFDIVAATFVLASDFQDLISLERDEFDRLRAMDSLQYKLGVLGFPVVNYYSLFLKEEIEKYFGIAIELKTYDGGSCGMALTHDVDFISFLNPRMIRREMFGIAVLNRHMLGSTQRLSKLLFPLFALFGYDLPKIGLHFLRNTEIANSVKSTFFIKTGATAKQDIPYNYKSRSMRDFMRSLTGEEFEIGIHPSMNTYVNVNDFVREKNRLQDILGRSVKSVRQHYLRFTAGKTIEIWEKAEMKYDSTLGFSREVGFRNSIAFPYPLYNFAEDRISRVTELPLILMDGTLAENKTITNEHALKWMKDLVRETKIADGGAAILFHNSVTDPIDFPGYTEMYTELLHEVKSSGFSAGTLAGTIENFR